MKKIVGIIVIFILYALTGKGRVYACGTGSFTFGTGCDVNCNLIGVETWERPCHSNGNQCVMSVKWTGCYLVNKGGEQVCEFHSNFTTEVCGDYVQPTPGGGGCAPAPPPSNLQVACSASEDSITLTWDSPPEAEVKKGSGCGCCHNADDAG